MAGLLTYDWHPPDPTGAVNAYLSGVRIGMQEKQQAAQEQHYAQKLAADALERDRLRKRFEAQQALQQQQEARLAGAEQLRQAYTRQRMQSAADLVNGQRTAADGIVDLFSGGGQAGLPSGGVTAPRGAAESLIPTDSRDPLVGQAPPIDPQDNATFDDFAGQIAPVAADEDQFELDPVSGTPRLVKAGVGTVGADMAALPRNAAGRLIAQPPAASGALPAASGAPLPANPLLDAVDGYSLVGKPTASTPVPRAQMPDMASILSKLPPKDVIGVAKQAAAAQLRDSLKPVKPAATPAPRQFGNDLIRVNADDSITTLATKPAATPKPASPTTTANSLLTERAQYQGQASKAQLELDKITKGKDPQAFDYPWKEENGELRMWAKGKGSKTISKAEFDAQMALAKQVNSFRDKITSAEQQSQELAAKIGEARAPGAPAASSAPAQVTTKAQYDALPSGASYVGPDGKRATKR